MMIEQFDVSNCLCIVDNLKFHLYRMYSIFIDLISGCGLGEFLNGSQCDTCPIGSYQDKSFHTDVVCMSCSGTLVVTVST